MCLSFTVVCLACSIWKGNFRCRDHTRALVRAGVVIATTLLLLVLRVSLLYGHLPHFSAQDNPASFSDSMLTRMWTYGYLAYFNCKLAVFASCLHVLIHFMSPSLIVAASIVSVPLSCTFIHSFISFSYLYFFQGGVTSSINN